MKHLKRYGIALLAFLMVVSAFPVTALAGYAFIESQTEPVQYFESLNEDNWSVLKTPQHYNADTGDVAYCLEHKRDNPKGVNYSEFDPTEEYPYDVYQGLYAILSWGYPAGGTGGLTADQARYGTANAIRFWLSESQTKYGTDFGQYRFTDLTRSGTYVRPRASVSNAQAVWEYAMALLDKARNGVMVDHSISVSPSTVEMTKSGSAFVGQVHVDLTNCSGGYTYDVSSFVGVSGYTGQDGDVLTLSVPAQYAGQRIQMTFSAYDDRSTANYAWYMPVDEHQKVVLIGTSMEKPAVTDQITLVTPDNGGIEVVKKGDGGELLSGAVFEVKDAAGQLAGTITTDGKGHGSLDGLEPGVYTVQEVTAPSGYLMDTTIHKVTVEVAATVTVQAVNTAIKGTIEIRKTNDDPAMGDYALSGAVFTIYDGNGKAVDTVTTDETGKGVSKLLPVGSYTVQETTAPPGFVASTDRIPITLSPNGTAPVVSGSVTVPNTPQTGRITIVKRDAQTGAEPQGGLSLYGAQFEILDATGQVVETLTAQTDTVTSRELPLGDYIVREIKPPKGYAINPTEFPVALSYGGQDAAIVEQTVTVEDQVVRGRIAITKFGRNGSGSDIQQALAGVEFEIRDQETGELAATLTTDEFGYAISDTIYYGVYTVTETKGAEGFAPVEPFDVVIDTDGKTYSYILEDKAHQSEIKIVKIDAETGKTIAKAGIQFRIQDEQGAWVTQKQLYPTPQEISVFETAADGTLTLPQPLRYGRYSLYEVTAPDGYLLSEKPLPFTVGENTPLLEVKVENMPAKGRITVEKTGPAFTGVTKEDTEYGEQIIPVFTDVPLKDAVFEIRATQDIVTQDGTLRLKAGEVADVLTTGEDGMAVSCDLYLGEYELIEIQSPAGYLLDSTPHPVSLQYQDQHTAIVAELVGIHDDRPHTELTLLKHAETFDQQLADITLMPGDGFVFGLFAADEINGVGAALPKDAMVWVGSTDMDGRISVEVPLPYGGYYFKELAAPNAYQVTGERYPVTLTYKNQDRIAAVANGGEPVINRLKTGRIRIIKLDDRYREPNFLQRIFGSGESEAEYRLASAVFQIRSEALGICVELTTDGHGEALSPKLPIGEYVIQEVQAPAGFELTEESQSATITGSEAEVLEYTFRNAPKKVHILKVSSMDGRALPGCEMEIRSADGSVIYSATTDSAGEIAFDMPPAGTYVIAEVKAPAGFVRSPKTHSFTVTDAGEITGETTVMNDPIRIEILKVDAETGEKLPGATIQITDAAGKEVYQGVTDKEGKLAVIYLEPGDYRYTELKPPAGYARATVSVPFHIDEDGSVTGEMTLKNKRLEVVLTKTDITGAEPVPGAKVEILDKEGQVVFEDITDAKGQIRTTKLVPGKYTFRETLAPTGYALNPNTYAFEILEDGTVRGETGMKDDYVRLTVKKVDGKTGRALQGAQFGLYDNTGKLLMTGETDKTGFVEFAKLKPGSYVIREIKAPEGYVTSGKTVPIQVTETYINQDAFVFENTSTVPQTGVNNLPWWGYAMMIVLLGCCMLAVGVRLKGAKS